MRLHTAAVAMEFLSAISNTAFATWVRESGSLFGYPGFILLHTIGLATLVGLSSIVALLVLGSAPAAVLGAVRPIFRWIWAGFALNAASGLVLFAADAPSMFLNRVMWVKFVFVVAAVLIVRALQHRVAFAAAGGTVAIAGSRSSGRWLATATLLCWVGAIVTGRLTAYIGPILPLE